MTKEARFSIHLLPLATPRTWAYLPTHCVPTGPHRPESLFPSSISTRWADFVLVIKELVYSWYQREKGLYVAPEWNASDAWMMLLKMQDHPTMQVLSVVPPPAWDCGRQTWHRGHWALSRLRTLLSRNLFLKPSLAKELKSGTVALISSNMWKAQLFHLDNFLRQEVTRVQEWQQNRSSMGSSTGHQNTLPWFLILIKWAHCYFLIFQSSGA